MTCDRCMDVHNAQKSGLTQQSCKCDCHYNNQNYTGTLVFPNTTSTLTHTAFNCGSEVIQ